VDEAGAAELADNPTSFSCAHFADRATNGCDLLDRAGVSVWVLKADNGSTLVWYDGVYRYELFGRTFVPVGALAEMVPTFVPLVELSEPAR